MYVCIRTEQIFTNHPSQLSYVQAAVYFLNFQINHNLELAMPSKAIPFPTGIGIDLIQISRIESIFKGSLQIQSMGAKDFQPFISHKLQQHASRLRETYKTNFRPRIDPAQKKYGRTRQIRHVHFLRTSGGKVPYPWALIFRFSRIEFLGEEKVH